METSYLLLLILWVISTVIIAYLLYEQKRNSAKLKVFSEKNNLFLESIEKYVEIFNAQNVNKLLLKRDQPIDILAEKKIKSIRDDYRLKLISQNSELKDEHEMLIDFVTLALSLLIKTPPSLRKRLIQSNTDNEIIKKILLAKLSSIEKYYVPVSLLEVAISNEDN